MAASVKMERAKKQAIPVTVNRSNMRHELGFFRTWAVMARNIWRARDLVWQLFKRDFFAGYKKSFIGVTWVLISPLVGIVSWVFLQLTGMLQPGDVGIPYPAYVLLGTTMWGLFVGLYEAGATTLQAGQELVLQVNFPREALLFKQTASFLSNFLISFCMTVSVIIVFGVTPSWKIALLPLVAVPLFLLGAAVGLVVSMIGVVAIDLKTSIGMGIKMLMYGTPLIYSDTVPNTFVQAVIKWNPLTYLICSCRDIVLYGRLYNAPLYFACSLGSLLLFLISWRLFYVSEHRLVERMI